MKLKSSAGHIAIFVLLALVLGGCASSSNISRDENDSSSRSYDLDIPHPDYKVYHHTEDSSRLHFQFDLRQFLFTRPDPNEPFEANVRIEFELIKPDAEEEDTSPVKAENLTFVSNPDQPGTVNSFIAFDFPMGKQSKLEVSLIDQNRGTRYKKKLIVDKTENSSQFYLIRDKSNKVIFHNWHAGPGTLHVQCDVNPPEELGFYHYTDEISLPPPPFSMVERSLFDVTTGIKGRCEKKNESFYFNSTKGLYSFFKRSEEDILFSLWIGEPHFPTVGKLDKMIETSRFIMSKSEFDKIAGHKERKARMDAFWLENAGSKERARELIRTYYSRVEEANYYFTSYMPGWKTDRGLIHIIFGNPKKIFRGPDFEKWLYGEENNLNSLSFTFNRDRDAISENHFILARDMSYRTFWDRAVQSWRSGRIYNQ